MHFGAKEGMENMYVVRFPQDSMLKKQIEKEWTIVSNAIYT